MSEEISLQPLVDRTYRMHKQLKIAVDFIEKCSDYTKEVAVKVEATEALAKIKELDRPPLITPEDYTNFRKKKNGKLS